MPRPKSLEPDARTLGMLRGLGQISATKEEVATALGVSRPTLWSFFKEFPEAEEHYERGLGEHKISLRRVQWNLAKKGSTAMAIWLGKQLLGQKDNYGVEHSGKVETNATQIREGIERKLARIAETPERGQEIPSELN